MNLEDLENKIQQTIARVSITKKQRNKQTNNLQGSFLVI